MDFLLRVHFDYEKPERQFETPFKRGDIFQVTDTLYEGQVNISRMFCNLPEFLEINFERTTKI
jgi:hypothetical protein